MSGLRVWDTIADLVLILACAPSPTSRREGRCSFATSLAAGPATATLAVDTPLLDVLLPAALELELLPELLVLEPLLLELLPEELLPLGVLAIEAPLELPVERAVPVAAESSVAVEPAPEPPPHAASVASRTQPAPRISNAWNICCAC
jgi:hypothetical protein